MAKRLSEPGTCGEFVVDAARVAQARETALPPETVEALAETFKVLGNATRIRILHALATQELCVCDLAEVVGLSVSAVSHQLGDLRRLRFVEFRSEGKLAWYRLTSPTVRWLLAESSERVSRRAGAA
ncbi:MAG: ArsR/SmtB family transcription factor [Myxococcota bacterium]